MTPSGFLARQLRPFRSEQIPLLDLSIILEGLAGHPFEASDSQDSPVSGLICRLYLLALVWT